jgi:hypothetical protein
MFVDKLLFLLLCSKFIQSLSKRIHYNCHFINYLNYFFKEYDYVTCQSVLKLQNVNSGARLHSHDVKYGSGSGQQVF